MKYKEIKEAIFLSRPNRFMACVKIDEEEQMVHVKNTGRCKEILKSGSRVILEKAQNPNRKTQYSLVAAYKNKSMLINIDSQITNYVAQEGIKQGKIEIFKDLEVLKKEVTYKHSRFDFYYEKNHHKGFIEVKSVTLEKDGEVSFPDAPTERGRKHIKELIELQEQGYKNYILFVIQIEKVKYFTPNGFIDEEFQHILKKAYEKGVGILAYNCCVQEDFIDMKEKIKIKI